MINAGPVRRTDYSDQQVCIFYCGWGGRGDGGHSSFRIIPLQYQFEFLTKISLNSVLSLFSSQNPDERRFGSMEVLICL